MRTHTSAKINPRNIYTIESMPQLQRFPAILTINVLLKISFTIHVSFSCGSEYYYASCADVLRVCPVSSDSSYRPSPLKQVRKRDCDTVYYTCTISYAFTYMSVLMFNFIHFLVEVPRSFCGWIFIKVLHLLLLLVFQSLINSNNRERDM